MDLKDHLNRLRTCFSPESYFRGFTSLGEGIARVVSALMLLPIIIIIALHFPRRGYMDTVCFISLFLFALWFILVLTNRKHFRVIAISVLFILFINGIISLYMKGLAGIGGYLLFILPITTGFFLGYRWMILTLCLNGAVLVTFKMLALSGKVYWHNAHGIPNDFILHYLVIDVIYSLAVTAVTKRLERSHEKEKSICVALELESRELIRTNEQLEREMEERCRAEETLREREKWFRAMIEQSSEVIMIMTIEGSIVFASRSVEKVFGAKAEDIQGTNAFDYVHPDDREEVLMQITQGLSSNVDCVTTRYRNRHKDGSWLILETTCSNQFDNPIIDGFLLNIRNITEQEKALERARYLEDYDSLTHLPNREMFMKRLRAEIMRAGRKKRLFAVLFVNIDRFKEVNEMYGPLVGDRVLRHIADRLRGIYRGEDFVARLAGDVFGILLSDITTYDDAIEILDRTRRIIADPIAEGDVSLRLTASVGVSLYPNDGETVEVLLRNCESALHVAKGGGRNMCHFFDRTLHDNLLRRISLEKELDRAIARDEFIVYYQPKVDQNGFIFGMEALVRWISRSLGEVSPLEFIPVAEGSGLILDIGYIVLRKACRQNRIWIESGLGELTISVNLSPYQFRNKNLVEDIQRITSEEGLPPNLLELEITESGIMEDEADTLKKLAAIHAMGVKISIDDFGTGYSSLSKLKTYPVDTLKIDRSFVEDVPYDMQSVKIINSIVSLAHNLGFNIIAEGVERVQQIDFFVYLGCDRFQGFYFYPPLPASEFEHLARQQLTDKTGRASLPLSLDK